MNTGELSDETSIGYGELVDRCYNAESFVRATLHLLRQVEPKTRFISPDAGALNFLRQVVEDYNRLVSQARP